MTKVSHVTTNGQTLYVTNTDGLGVYLRSTPDPADKVRVWPDGTPMVVVGPDQSSAGTIWKNVRDPDGNLGWIPDAYLTPRNPVAESNQVEANGPLVFVGTPRYVPKVSGGVVEGIVQNTGPDTRSGILRALLVDSSGNPVAVANGVVSDVAPGQSGVYVLFSTQSVPQVSRLVPQVVVSHVVSDPARVAFQNVTVQSSPSGPVVVGNVRNDDTVPLSVALIGGFIGTHNDVDGTARGIVDALQPGQTMAFTLKPEDPVSAYNHVIVQIAAVTISES